MGLPRKIGAVLTVFVVSASNAFLAPLQSWGPRIRVHPSRAVDPTIFVPEGVEFRSWLGFLGGSVGVIGTLLTYEKDRFRMKQRILCPYCTGEGVITCASCCGCGSVLRPVDPSSAASAPEQQSQLQQSSGSSGRSSVTAGQQPMMSVDGVLSETCQCGTCDGIGVVACVNCRGEGVSVPVVLQRKQTNMNVNELEMALEEMGVASLAANFANQKARARLSRELAAAAARVEAKAATSEEAAAAAARGEEVASAEEDEGVPKAMEGDEGAAAAPLTGTDSDSGGGPGL